MNIGVLISVPFMAALVFSGAFFEQFFIGSRIETSSLMRIFNSLVYLPLYFFAMYELFRSNLLSYAKSKYFFPLFAFCLLSITSCIWALDPVKSFIDSIQLFCTVLLSLAIVTRYDSKYTSDALTNALFLFLVCSLLYIFYVPSLGLMNRIEYSNLLGAPQGIFTHKNRLSEIASLAICLCVSGVINRGLFFKALLLFISCYVLILGGSAAKLIGIACAILLLATYSVNRTKNSKFLWAFSIVMVIMLAYILLPLYDTYLLSSLGKNESLTGRLPLWEFSIQVFTESPILGFGAGSIWDNDLINMAYNAFYKPPHSHNLFIETLLKFGIVGLFFLLVCMYKKILLLVKPSISVSQPYFRLYFLILISLLVRSPFEYTLFRDNQISFLILLITYGYVLKESYLIKTKNKFFK